jgi:hypothetical protein
MPTVLSNVRFREKLNSQPSPLLPSPLTLNGQARSVLIMRAPTNALRWGVRPESVPTTIEPSAIGQNHKRIQLCMSSQFYSEWRATSIKNPAPCAAGGGFKLSSPRSLGRNGRSRGRRSELTTAPGTTADTTDTRPHHAGIARDPFWYHVLEGARAIVFEWCRATRAGIAIIPRRATVRC